MQMKPSMIVCYFAVVGGAPVGGRRWWAPWLSDTPRLLVPAIYTFPYNLRHLSGSSAPPIYVLFDFKLLRTCAHLHCTTSNSICACTQMQPFELCRTMMSLFFAPYYLLILAPFHYPRLPICSPLQYTYGRHVICVSDGMEFPLDESYCRFSCWTYYFYSPLAFCEYNLVSSSLHLTLEWYRLSPSSHLSKFIIRTLSYLIDQLRIQPV